MRIEQYCCCCPRSRMVQQPYSMRKNPRSYDYTEIFELKRESGRDLPRIPTTAVLLIQAYTGNIILVVDRCDHGIDPLCVGCGIMRRYRQKNETAGFLRCILTINKEFPMEIETADAGPLLLRVGCGCAVGCSLARLSVYVVNTSCREEARLMAARSCRCPEYFAVGWTNSDVHQDMHMSASSPEEILLLLLLLYREIVHTFSIIIRSKCMMKRPITRPAATYNLVYRYEYLQPGTKVVSFLCRL